MPLRLFQSLVRVKELKALKLLLKLLRALSAPCNFSWWTLNSNPSGAVLYPRALTFEVFFTMWSHHKCYIFTSWNTGKYCCVVTGKTIALAVSQVTIYYMLQRLHATKTRSFTVSNLQWPRTHPAPIRKVLCIPSVVESISCCGSGVPILLTRGCHHNL